MISRDSSVFKSSQSSAFFSDTKFPSILPKLARIVSNFAIRCLDRVRCFIFHIDLRTVPSEMKLWIVTNRNAYNSRRSARDIAHRRKKAKCC